MREKILKIAQDKNLQGNEEVIYQFGKYLVDECILMVDQAKINVGTTYDKSISDSTKAACMQAIYKRFMDENV